MEIHESEEMYLETILRLQKSSANVRSIDIASELNYSRPSVSKAVGLLKQKGYIIVEREGGAIRLTSEGKAKAEKVYERHQIITELLMRTGVPEDIAEDNACRVEHVLTDECFEYLKNAAKKS